MIKCWHYRRIISRSADESEPLPPATLAHVAQCHGCRLFYETERELLRRLSVGAAAANRLPPSPVLHTRIMGQIVSAQPDSNRPARPVPGYWAIAFAAACIGLTTVLLWPARPGPGPSPGQIARVQPPPAATTAASMEWPDPKALAQWAANPGQPLDTEMQSVLHDARGAVTALADNFFPEKIRQTILQQTSSQN